MRRRHRRDHTEKLVSAAAGFVGLIVVACIAVPGVRAVFAGILQLLFVGIGISLVIFIGWVLFRHYRDAKTGESRGVPNTAPQRVAQEEPFFRSGRSAVEKTQPKSKAATQPQTPAFFSFRRPPIEDEGCESSLADKDRTAMSKELLDALEWRRFEELVTWYIQKTGLDAKRSRVGADGGVDVLVSKKGDPTPFAYVQCKAWHQYKVGIKPVRELFGVMASDRIQRGYFVTTGEFTEEALCFAQGKEMILLTGRDMLSKINALSESDRTEILRRITAGDYTTPTCPRCDVKMVRRTGSDGDFWGCVNYSKRPSCRQTFKMREMERSAAE